MNDLMTKSFVNYVDLKKEAMKDLEAGHDSDPNLSSRTNSMDRNLDRFLEEAEKVKQEMKEINEILVKLHESKEESKSVNNPESMKALRNKINKDIIRVLKKAKNIKSQLEEMDGAKAADNKCLSGCKKGIPVYRTRIAVKNGSRKRLKGILMEFHCLRDKMMKEYKETIGRRYFIITGEYPDEEIIEKITSGEGDEFLTPETVAEIQEIEKSLLELHQIFLDMGVMVEAEGEEMDDIEGNVLNSSHYVKDCAKELNTCKGYMKKSRKWICVGVILLLLIILVVVIPFFTSFSRS